MTQQNGDEGRFANLSFVLRGNGRGLVLVAFLSVVTAVCETFLLGAIVQSISAISSGRSQVTGLGPWSWTVSVRTLLIGAVAAALTRAALTALVAILGPRITAQSRERHRLALFDTYLRADWATQSADKTGRFLQTLSSSVNDANTIVLLTAQAVPAVITLTVLITVSLVINPLVTGGILVIGAVVGAGLRPLSKRAHRLARADAAARAETAGHVSGVLAAGSEIAVLGSREGVYAVGRERIQTSEHAFGRSRGIKGMVSSAGQSVAFIFATTGLLVISGTQPDINFTTVGTITLLLLRSAGLAQQVQGASSQYGTVVPFVEQVRLLIGRYEAHRQTFGEEAFPDRFDIEVDGVEYAYPGTTQPAVRVDRAIFPQGSMVAILGPSGSGKSTLMQVVLRLRNPTHGAIRIGGVAATAISADEFSQKVAYVPQAPHLVPTTILENIRFYRPHVSDDDIFRAAQLAHLHEDIARMEQGYDTMLDSHVDALSGGQKQRLALARALATRPVVLVLDEPTSALDVANEAAVMSTLRELRESTTVVIVTHKPSTSKDCDIVLDLQGGQLRRRDARPPFGRQPVTVPSGSTTPLTLG